ncbi:flagellar motor switch protein FliG [Methylophaga pinxianii]|uniref:flagellar motor switch protein FliG n=1 Tax=Methylophaga pinxianii TaxID=2881052 RepID=UPI001CF19E72|nr:flagellar motor switch protein FliG [Methylophaga pinxianii]MCB2427803.1 flagellar motor switch protein FliG [Methylophaga pinxianii]UPH45592.1 flagellar motor switch protein FliG [Methylophaga pinxianii]
MAEQPRKLTGTEKAAVFLRSIGEEEAAQVLKHMGPKEVQKIGQAMATLTNVTRVEVETVLDNFVTTVEQETGLGIGSHDYVRKMLVGALGEERAGGLLDRILSGGNTNGLEQLKWMDARAIYEVIRLEHPQIVAIVCSFLDSDQAAQVLGMFPERDQAAILLRVATLDGVQPAALSELNEILEKQFSGNAGGQTATVGGPKTAADILNFVEGSREAAIMEKIKEAEPDLGQNIEDLMFVFDNLIDVDDRGMQTLMREIQTDQLQLALKGADENLKEKFLKNMSQRAAEMLRDDLEAMGPVRVSDVEAAQKSILATARMLSEKGDIALGSGGGGDDFI